jgi:hypothetical protein
MLLPSRWFSFGEDGGVLELDEALTAPGRALELHVVIDSELGRTIAWWENEEGAFLGAPLVGDA